MMQRIETLDRYQIEALRTIGTSDLPILALGVAGETSEVLDVALAARLTIAGGKIADIVKKELGHGHPRDREKMAKELGDVLWYIAAMAEEYGYSLSEIATMNIEKLKARYPGGFTVEGSLNREEGLAHA